MRGAGKTVDDERIPRVPRGRRVTRTSGKEEKKEPGGGEIGDGEEELVEERTGGKPAHAGEDQFGAGRIDGL